MAYSASVFRVQRYETDRGVLLSYKVLDHIATELDSNGDPKVGGQIADGTELRPGPSFKPRVALLWNAANKLARRVVCFAPNSVLYASELRTGNPPAVGDMTLSLYGGRPSTLLVFTCYGYEGERDRGKRV